MIYRLEDRHVSLAGEVAYIADNATVIGSVTLGQDASVWFNAVIRGDSDDIVVGARSNIQDGAVLHTDPGFRLELGDNVTVGHQATLHGCRVGNGSLIGINAVLLNGAVIGRECLIGANSLVPEGKQIPDRSLVVGSPCRILRTLTDDEAANLRRNADEYVEKGRRYRHSLHADKRFTKISIY